MSGERQSQPVSATKPIRVHSYYSVVPRFDETAGIRFRFDIEVDIEKLGRKRLRLHGAQIIVGMDGTVGMNAEELMKGQTGSHKPGGCESRTNNHAAMPTTKVAGCGCLPSSRPRGDVHDGGF